MSVIVDASDRWEHDICLHKTHTVSAINMVLYLACCTFSLAQSHSSLHFICGNCCFYVLFG